MSIAPSQIKTQQCRYCQTPIQGRDYAGTCAACMLAIEPVREASVPCPLPRPSLAQMRGALPEFEILELAGVGGHGNVFKAREREFGRVVAIKAIQIGSADDELAKRFELECTAMAQLRHQRIPAIFWRGSVGNIHYVTMDWMSDGCLEDLLARRTPLGLPMVVRVIDQLCEALGFAHREQVIHRDVKPSNILLDGEAIRLTDFGLAKRILHGHGLTRIGVRIGTPGYMAPEQAESGNVDHRTDIYSVGAVFYRLLTQREPRGNFMLPPSRYGCPKAFDAIVLKAMAADPQDRFADINALRKALMIAWRRQQIRRWGWPIIAICAVLAGAAIGWTFHTSS